ncbi:MAG: hypothetical protein NZ533_07355 [Casimicrobiaceae bacterium]|nr:hypothetical protein [Casimicrobiaceae bacterium]MCX8098950.1 hypothetical protein [Casimicrobiaceae bacterium]MDW8313139.1 hypothetical protein [Burkholderiales bacterium]
MRAIEQILSTRRARLACRSASALLVGLLAAGVWAQAAPGGRTDALLTKEELRACLLAKQANDREAASIRAEQEAFVREHDAIRADQAELKRQAEALEAERLALRAEDEAISRRLVELSLERRQAKSEAERAPFDAEEQALRDRRRRNDLRQTEHVAAVREHGQRVDALNARIEAINARGRTINDRVAPLQARIEAWRTQCANRRYREEDEIALRKELGL